MSKQSTLENDPAGRPFFITQASGGFSGWIYTQVAVNPVAMCRLKSFRKRLVHNIEAYISEFSPDIVLNAVSPLKNMIYVNPSRKASVDPLSIESTRVLQEHRWH